MTSPDGSVRRIALDARHIGGSRPRETCRQAAPGADGPRLEPDGRPRAVPRTPPDVHAPFILSSIECQIGVLLAALFIA